eukprot:TRINITY_DN16013_c0_g2_i1.p1 TRINITY_DN16013_c0_g2~~TRINITY_DN16013_c0_g2_i1.p1  ORF type:complete len:254 (-),score=39.85 TRINITY_DN16013_c0_g2_i1:281-1042(-)
MYKVLRASQNYYQQSARMQAIQHVIDLIDSLLVKIESDRKAVASQQSNSDKNSSKQESKKSSKQENKKQKQDKNVASKGDDQQIPQQHEFFVKAKIKVGKVILVEEIEGSDKLYKCQVDLGEEKRQVVAGLKKYLNVDELLNRLVVCVCNLKPAKLAGETSEAMIMAAETQNAEKVVVKTLIPPEGSSGGDEVWVQGVDVRCSVKQMKSDHWKKVMEQMRVLGGKACHASTPLTTQNGLVTLPDTIPDDTIIK